MGTRLESIGENGIGHRVETQQRRVDAAGIGDGLVGDDERPDAVRVAPAIAAHRFPPSSSNTHSPARSALTPGLVAAKYPDLPNISMRAVPAGEISVER